MADVSDAGLKATNTNFIVPCISDEGKELRIYVPQPLEKELRGIARVLGEIYGLVKSKHVEFEVFLKDCSIYVDEILERLENSDLKRKALEAYLERCLLNATIFTADGDELEQLSEDEKEVFRSSLLFISALYRYTMRAMQQNELQDFFTSSTATELKSSLRKSQSQSTAADAVITKRA